MGDRSSNSYSVHLQGFPFRTSSVRVVGNRMRARFPGVPGPLENLTCYL